MGYEELGSHEQGSHEQGSHEQGSHEQGSHEQGSHEQGSHEQGSHEQGRSEPGGSEPGGHGGSSVRGWAPPAAGPVVDLAERTPTTPVRRAPRRRTTRAVLAAAVVAGTAALVVQHGRGVPVAPTPSATASPTPRADFPTAVETATTPVLSSSTDVTTFVTRAQLHLAKPPTAADLEAIRTRFDGVDLGAGYGFRASDPEQGDDEPGQSDVEAKGPSTADVGRSVTMFFSGELTAEATLRLKTVLAQIAPARGWAVARVRGTTVDIAVPFVAGPRSCVDADGVVTDRGLAASGGALPFYALRVIGDRLVITYTGPLLSDDTLATVGRTLARSCDQPATTVTYTRPPR